MELSRCTTLSVERASYLIHDPQRKGLLHIMFAGAYFDGSQLVKVVANAPFDRLLELPDRDGVG